MASGRNEKWEKMTLGKTARQKLDGMGIGRSLKGRKKDGRNVKSLGEMGMGETGLGKMGINLFFTSNLYLLLNWKSLKLAYEVKGYVTLRGKVFNALAKSFNLFQFAQFAPADIGRNFLLVVNILYHKIFYEGHSNSSKPLQEGMAQSKQPFTILIKSPLTPIHSVQLCSSTAIP